MFKKIMNLHVNEKFLLVSGFFVLVGLISIIALIEVAKFNDFQRFERNHLESLETIIFHTESLITITSPDESAIIIKDILDAKSDIAQEMGVVQTLEKMKSLPKMVLERLNFLEIYIFKLFGFVRIFELVDDDIGIITNMQNTIQDYKNRVIVFDIFAAKLVDFTKKVREYNNEFAAIINDTSHFISRIIIIAVAVVLSIAGIFGFFIYRGLMKPVNEAKNNIQTSSQQLQANSKQQLQSASHQSTAMAEISSVMQQLVATSGQVSEISSKAAGLAKDTDNSVGDCHVSLDKALDGIKKIREKSEIIASNMLSFNEKSQQIGMVLDIINELSQQVTVLSYNATIEAAGAGEAGKRFMAVADRIIKLAERSVESAKEVKSIVDDIQKDSHKATMSAEDGIKAVAEGVAYNAEVKHSLDKINGFTNRVLSSMDEINISLNQQKTGVEQAATEVENIATLVKETEDSSSQVLETSEQLLEMADMLGKI